MPLSSSTDVASSPVARLRRRAAWTLTFCDGRLSSVRLCNSFPRSRPILQLSRGDRVPAGATRLKREPGVGAARMFREASLQDAVAVGGARRNLLRNIPVLGDLAVLDAEDVDDRVAARPRMDDDVDVCDHMIAVDE